MQQAKEQKIKLLHCFMIMRSEIAYQRAIEVKNIPDSQLNMGNSCRTMPYGIIPFSKILLAEPAAQATINSIYQTDQYQPAKCRMKG